MTVETTHRTLDELDHLLDHEREALLDGRLEEIARMVELKATLIGQLNQPDEAAREPLARIRDKLARNQALLSGAMEGIRAVSDRMDDLRKVRKGLETYDNLGRRTKCPASPHASVEKRA